MVSFWPFGKSDNSSAASFEKTLSQLSTRINRYAAQRDSLRSAQRRYKALWTLYASFAYILVAAILTLVTGWDKWGPAEYTALAGSPLAIYGVRTGLDSWYNYRLARTQRRLEESSSEREKVIERLKAATKYDSTQQLLDKYGGAPKQQQQQQQQRDKSPKRKPSGRQSLPAQLPPPGPRTGFAPPPTANIPARAPPPPQPVDTPPSAGAGESFAPNAFPTPSAPSFPPQGAPPPSAPQYAPPPAGPAWYDRILDVVLGEDETQAKNRFALICAQCRLVNGQAPPGARSLEDVGRWKCKECGAMNGLESEVGQVLAQAELRGMDVGNTRGSGEEAESEESVEEEQEAERADSPPASSTRSKARQRRKA